MGPQGAEARRSGRSRTGRLSPKHTGGDDLLLGYYTSEESQVRLKFKLAESG